MRRRLFLFMRFANLKWMKPNSAIDLLLYIALGALSLFILFGHTFLPHGHTEGSEHAGL